jgi:hypothetical protein
MTDSSTTAATTTVSGPSAAGEADRAAMLAMRRLTQRWVAIGWCSFAVVFTAAWWFTPRLAPIAEPLDRLLFVLQLGAAPGFVLVCMLQGLWRMQDTLEAEDPFANKESLGFRINQRVMTNTMEQTLMFLPILIGFAIRMEPAQAYWLPLLVTFWCVARIMFWVGYRRALHLRAPGMDWTTGTLSVTAVLFVISLF